MATYKEFLQNGGEKKWPARNASRSDAGETRNK
jgi:hypothetical protein